MKCAQWWCALYFMALKKIIIIYEPNWIDYSPFDRQQLAGYALATCQFGLLCLSYRVTKEPFGVIVPPTGRNVNCWLCLVLLHCRFKTRSEHKNQATHIHYIQELSIGQSYNKSVWNMVAYRQTGNTCSLQACHHSLEALYNPRGGSACCYFTVCLCICL